MAQDSLRNSIHEEQISGIEQQCQQILYAIGNKLAAQRESQRGSLETISKDLKIRSSLLRAIEQGNIADFPGDSYYYGFTRNYAKALSLDISDEIKNYRKLREKQERNVSLQPESKIMNVDSPIISPRSDRSKIAAATIVSTTSAQMMNDNAQLDEKTTFSQLMSGSGVPMRGSVVLVVIGFVAVLFYALWIVVVGLNQQSSRGEQVAHEELPAAADESQNLVDSGGELTRQNEQSNETEQGSSVFRLSKNVVQDSDETAPAAVKTVRKGREYGSPVNSRVWIEAIRGSWISVVDVSKVDIEAGQTGEIFARQLKPNDIYYAPPGDQIFLKAGDAGGVRLVLDNKKQDVLGRNGQVRYSSLDAKSILSRQNFVYGAKLNELLQAVKRAQSR